MGPRESQDLRSPSPIMAPVITKEMSSACDESKFVAGMTWRYKIIAF